MTNINTIRVIHIVWFFPTQNNVPKLLSYYAATHVENGLTQDLLNPVPESPFVTLDATQTASLQ